MAWRVKGEVVCKHQDVHLGPQHLCKKFREVTPGLKEV